MSKVKDNMVTRGLSGKLGKQVVFRQWGGTTFLTKSPVRGNRTLTEGELKHRQSFKQASVYGKMVMNDPDLQPLYKAKCKVRQNVYSRALQDYLISPVIEKIDISNYTGEVNSTVRVFATDDFMVKKVEVVILDENQNTIESGSATKDPKSDWWSYSTTARNANYTGGKIVAFAYDFPENETSEEAFI